jgi:mannosyl-oligosaccharide alpha-1,2-mannosidase
VSIAAATTIGGFSAFWLSGSTISSELKLRWLPTPENEWENRREQVKDAFVSSWDAYSKYAWGESKYYIKTVRNSKFFHQATTSSTLSPNEAHK